MRDEFGFGFGGEELLHFDFGKAALGDLDVGDDAAVAHDEVAFAEVGDVELVGDHHDGDALLVELLKHAHDFDGGFAVEIARRFVGEEDLGLIHEGARDGDALLLSAGKLGREVIGALGEPDDLEGVEGAVAHLAGGEFTAAVKHGELDVFEGGGAGEEVEPLKDEAEFFVAEVGEGVAVEFEDVDAIEKIAAARRPVEAAERVHEGGFAGAAGAHDCHEFAAIDFERDAADGVDLDLAGIVDAVDVLKVDDGGHAMGAEKAMERVSASELAAYSKREIRSGGRRRRDWRSVAGRRHCRKARRRW